MPVRLTKPSTNTSMTATSIVNGFFTLYFGIAAFPFVPTDRSVENSIAQFQGSVNMSPTDFPFSLLMEISPDMMATQYVAVDYDGMDIYELSDYVSENVLPQLERVDGVASVSTTGLVEKSVQITLDQDKIDAVNDKLLVKVSDRLADAKKELDDNKKKINDGLKELDDAQAQLDAGKSELNTQKADVTTQLSDAIKHDF